MLTLGENGVEALSRIPYCFSNFSVSLTLFQNKKYLKRKPTLLFVRISNNNPCRYATQKERSITLHFLSVGSMWWVPSKEQCLRKLGERSESNLSAKWSRLKSAVVSLDSLYTLLLWSSSQEHMTTD